MAITKTPTTLYAAALVAAGTTVNAAELDLTTKAGARVMGKITNGASAPTTAPVVIFYSGEATGVKREIYRVTGDTVANSVTPFNCRYGLADMFANVSFTAGATNGSNLEIAASDAVL